MSKMRKKQMQRIFSLVMAVLLSLSLVGCGNPDSKSVDIQPADNEPAGSDVPQESQDSKGKEDDSSQVDSTALQETEKPAATKPITVSESYLAYMEAKSELSSLITDALASNPDTGLESMLLLGVVMVEIAMLPASSMGLGQEAAEMGMGFMGANNIQYTENGNQYIVTYNNQDGEGFEFKGVYDEATDALVCDVIADNNEGIYYEYRKVPFGYVGQVYSFEGDIMTELFKIVVHDKGGVIGISTDFEKPSALTGSESNDFPKDCPQWYAIDGTKFTGISSAGEELNFEYIPTPE